MPSRPGQRKSILSGPTLPVPVSPVFSWFDTWEVSSSAIETWQMAIPNDGMAYRLCNFNHAMIPTGWTISAIYLNDTIIWYQYEAWDQRWSPASERAPVFKFPDVLTVVLFHVYASYAVNHYWQMDFWREITRS